MAEVNVWCWAPDNFVAAVNDDRWPGTRSHGGNLASAVTAAMSTLVSPDFAELGDPPARLVLGDDPWTMEMVEVRVHGRRSHMVTVVRATEGTTAQAWSAGTTWQQVPLDAGDWQRS